MYILRVKLTVSFLFQKKKKKLIQNFAVNTYFIEITTKNEIVKNLGDLPKCLTKLKLFSKISKILFAYNKPSRIPTHNSDTQYKSVTILCSLTHTKVITHTLAVRCKPHRCCTRSLYAIKTYRCAVQNCWRQMCFPLLSLCWLVRTVYDVFAHTQTQLVLTHGDYLYVSLNAAIQIRLNTFEILLNLFSFHQIKLLETIAKLHQIMTLKECTEMYSSKQISREHENVTFKKLVV